MPRNVDPGTIKVGSGKPSPVETQVSLGGAGMVGPGPNVGEVEGAPPLDPLAAVANLPDRLHVFVGEGLDCFKTLAEAVAFVGEVTEPTAGVRSGRSWRITVVGPTNETATPIIIPTDGIHIEGAELRQTGLTQTTIRWNADNPLIDFNGKADLTFENLAFEYEDTGQSPLATPDRVVFTNDAADAGSLDVAQVTVRNCRFNGNTKAHGFLGIFGNFNNFVRCVFEHNKIEATDFGIAFEDADQILDCKFEHNTVNKVGTPQSSILTGIKVSCQGELQENLITANLVEGGFKRGIHLEFAGTGGTSAIQGNRVVSTTEIGIHVESFGALVEDNRLVSVHTSGVFSFGQTGRIGIWQEGLNASPENIIRIKDNTVDPIGGGATTRSILTEGVRTIVSGNRVDETLEVGDKSFVLANFVEGDDIVTGDDCQVNDNQMTFGDLIPGADSVVSGNFCDQLRLTAGSRALGNDMGEFGTLHLDNDVTVVGNTTRLLVTVGPLTGVVFKDNLIGPSGTSPQLSNSIIEGNVWEGSFFFCTGDGNTFTNNQFKLAGADVKFTGNNNIVDSNVLSVTSVITVDGNQNKVEGNDCGFIVDDAVGGGGQNENTVINDNTVRGTTGTPITVKSDGFILSDNWSEGDITIEGSNGTVSGNYLHTGGVLTLTSSDATTVTGNRLDFGGAGTALSVATSDDVVISNNIVGDSVNGGDVVITGDNVVVDSSRTFGDLTVTGVNPVLNGNIVGNDVAVTGDNAVVDGNKIFGTLTVTGVGPVISDNDPTLITVDGANAVIEGNKLSAGTPEAGTLQAGSSFFITLDGSASPDPDFYSGFRIRLLTGPGAGEERTIVDYTGGSRVASVSAEFQAPLPDNTTTYEIDAGVIRTLSANTAITGNQCTGIDLTNSGGFASVVGNHAVGVVSLQVGDHVIQGNQFSGDIRLSISDDNLIDGNKCRTLFIDASTRNAISDNVVEEIIVAGACTVADNRVTGNVSTSIALSISGDDLTITDNVFGAGMDVVLDSSVNRRVVFTGNSMDPARNFDGSSMSASSTDFILANNILGSVDLGAAGDCVLQGNHCSAITVAGVNPVISDNIVGDSVNGGIVVVSGNNAVIEGNRLQAGTPETGTAQAGALASITLAVGASADNDFYNGFRIRLLTGPGAGQERMVQNYFGGSKLVTVSSDWVAPPPDNTTTYALDAGVVRVLTSTNSIITGNQCTGIDLTLSGDFSSVRGNQAEGIALFDAGSNIIQGNQLSNDIGHVTSSDNLISDNKFRTLVLGSSVSRNMISNNHLEGEIKFTGTQTFCTIANNRVAGNAATSLALSMVGNDLTITDNVFGAGMDVVILGSTNNRVVFTGNSMDLARTFDGSAMTLGSTNLVIANNILGSVDLGAAEDCLFQGNRCGGTITGTGRDTLVQNNSSLAISITGQTPCIQNNLVAGTDNNITVASSGSLIQGNRCADIVLSGAPTGCSITNNFSVNIGINAAGDGPAPADTVAALNRVTGVVFGNAATGTALTPIENHNV